MVDHATDMERAVRRWTQTAAQLLFLRQFMMLLAGYFFLWGTLVLVLRVAMDMERRPLAWGAAGVAVLVIAAWWLAWRKRPQPTAVRAMLDDQNHAGGLYMAQAQDAGWAGHLPLVKLPQLRWRGGRQVMLTCLAGVFVALAFAVPRWVTQVGQPRPLDVSSQVNQMTKQLETLKQEHVLLPEQATEMTRKLAQVKSEANGSDPVKTWEALDHLQSQLQDAASQALEKAQSQAQKMAQAQTLAQALSEALKNQPDALSPQQMAQAMRTLQQMAQTAAAENEKLKKTMEEQGLSSKTGAMTRQQLDKIAKALSLSQERLQQLIQQIKENGLQPGKGGSASQEQGQLYKISPEELARALGQQMDQKSVQEIMDQLQQLAQMGQGQGRQDQDGPPGSPGSGGTGKGRGDAKMTWNDDPSSDQDTAFKDQILPKAKLDALKQSRQVGLSASAPKVAEGDEHSQGGVLTDQDAKGTAVTQEVLPRHRSAVREYFEHKDE